jgi:hypothetical protein
MTRLIAMSCVVIKPSLAFHPTGCQLANELACFAQAHWVERWFDVGDDMAGLLPEHLRMIDRTIYSELLDARRSSP